MTVSVNLNKTRKILGVNLKHVNSPHNRTIKNILGNKINSKKILGNKMKTIFGVNLKHVKPPHNRTLKNILGNNINSKKILGNTLHTTKRAVNEARRQQLLKDYQNNIKTRMSSNNTLKKYILNKPKFRHIYPEVNTVNNNISNFASQADKLKGLSNFAKNIMSQNKISQGKNKSFTLSKGTNLLLKTLSEGMMKQQMKKHGVNNFNNNNL